ncbi:MAG: sulfur carrier protein ThiS [Geminicoccaceae bacterium]
MKVIVNSEPREISGRTLADLLAELGFGGLVVATAVNGQFAPADGRAERELSEGDRVEILAPMQGG